VILFLCAALPARTARSLVYFVPPSTPDVLTSAPLEPLAAMLLVEPIGIPHGSSSGSRYDTLAELLQRSYVELARNTGLFSDVIPGLPGDHRGCPYLRIELSDSLIMRTFLFAELVTYSLSITARLADIRDTSFTFAQRYELNIRDADDVEDHLDDLSDSLGRDLTQWLICSYKAATRRPANHASACASSHEVTIGVTALTREAAEDYELSLVTSAAGRLTVEIEAGLLLLSDVLAGDAERIARPSLVTEAGLFPWREPSEDARISQWRNIRPPGFFVRVQYAYINRLSTTFIPGTRWAGDTTLPLDSTSQFVPDVSIKHQTKLNRGDVVLGARKVIRFSPRICGLLQLGFGLRVRDGMASTQMDTIYDDYTLSRREQQDIDVDVRPLAHVGIGIVLTPTAQIQAGDWLLRQFRSRAYLRAGLALDIDLAGVPVGAGNDEPLPYLDVGVGYRF